MLICHPEPEGKLLLSVLNPGDSEEEHASLLLLFCFLFPFFFIVSPLQNVAKASVAASLSLSHTLILLCSQGYVSHYPAFLPLPSFCSPPPLCSIYLMLPPSAMFQPPAATCQVMDFLPTKTRKHTPNRPLLYLRDPLSGQRITNHGLLHFLPSVQLNMASICLFVFTRVLVLLPKNRLWLFL